MTDYKEMVELLRRKSQVEHALERWDTAEDLEEAANAIEELIVDRDIYKELWFSWQEELKQAQAKCEDVEATLDTEIEYGNELKRKINSLKHDGYYTGTYIKALMEIENNDLPNRKAYQGITDRN